MSSDGRWTMIVTVFHPRAGVAVHSIDFDDFNSAKEASNAMMRTVEKGLKIAVVHNPRVLKSRGE